MLAGTFSLSTGSNLIFLAGESPILKFSSREDAYIAMYEHWIKIELGMCWVATCSYLL